MKFPKIRAKIVATLGPASSSTPILKALVGNGIDVFRLNFAHGNHEEHARHISSIRKMSQGMGSSIGILQDLPGPKLRVASVPAQGLDLARNEEVTLASRPSARGGKTILIRYPRLAEDLKRGHSVFVADGTIRLQVTSVLKDAVLCRVMAGGTVRAGNGVNMPKTSLTLKAFTREDRRHLAFGMAQRVDFVGVSFVGNASDIHRAKDFARKRGKVPLFIAKIERRIALKNLKSIIEAADGIMVARGDLGVEMPFNEVPGIQQEIVHRSHRMGKPVIVATQVLESMLMNPRPTRAEATDIANAVIEGADAIMLSGETSIGKYPVEAVAALREVIHSTEKRHAGFRPDHFTHGNQTMDVFIYEACKIAEGIGAMVFVIPTRTCLTASRVSQYRPPLPILALINDISISRKFSLHWGVKALLTDHSLSSGTWVKHVSALLLKWRWVHRGHKILIISGGPGGQRDRIETIQTICVQ